MISYQEHNTVSAQYSFIWQGANDVIMWFSLSNSVIAFFFIQLHHYGFLL